MLLSIVGLDDRRSLASPAVGGHPPPFEKRVGDLAGAYSRRIHHQHRLVYEVLDAERTVKIIRRWTHYS